MSVSSPTNSRVLSYAERAKKAQAIRSPIEVIQSRPSLPPLPPPPPPPPPSSTPSTTAQPSTTDPKPVNFWDRRKEEYAAKTAPPSEPSPTLDNISQNPAQTPAPELKPSEDDDDPFIVRSSRAPRQQPTAPSTMLPTENAEDWPQVGKSLPSLECTKPEEPRPTNGDNTQNTPKKGGPPKWVPLQLQAPAEVQPQPRKDPQTTRGNRQSANTSRASSNHGQGRNSRNHSGRNSANQSRIHSNAGSTQSSPRNPRNRRLPAEDPPASANTNLPITNRSSRTSSPLHVNPAQGTPPSFPPPDVSSQPSAYGNYLSPPQQGPSPFYSPQPPLPQVASPVYHSPSHGPHLPLPPDQSLPMPPPPVHAYPTYVYPTPYISYDYIPPSTPYPSYWNGHHSHPGSGTHSPVYPPSATPSTYAAALPIHIQQHFYPPPPMQQLQSHSQSSSVSGAPRNMTGSAASERGSVGKASLTNSPDAVATAIPQSSSAVVVTDSQQPRINGDIRRSTSVIFGSIETPPETAVSPSTVSVEEGDLKDGTSNGGSGNVEKAFKKLAIGMDPADAAGGMTKSSRRSVKGGGKDDHHHHHHHSKKVTTGVNGDIGVDPSLAKEAGSTGETKWKFGNEGLLGSPAGGVAGDLIAGGATTISNAEVMGSPVHNHQIIDVEEDLGDDFKVKNFGYGFGTSSSVPVDAPQGDTDVATKEQAEDEREGEEDSRPETIDYQPYTGPSNGRPRRGGYNNGYAFDRGFSGSGRRGGRGMNGFGGRGFNRSYGRGGNNHHHNGNASYQRQVGPPPPPSQYNVTSAPPHFQGLPPPPPHMEQYYTVPPPPPRGTPLATYIPTGFEPYPPPPPPPSHTHPSSTATGSIITTTTTAPTGQAGHGHSAPPPLPMPMSQLGFPLDSVRFYLLGQLEYYLSPQNMVQDYFLRQRMDSRGWIEIGLLASFNRVKALTRDCQLVREVLMLSTMVQVREHHVRMGGWERFVLPDAPKSVVEGEDEDYSAYVPQHLMGITSPSNPYASLPIGTEDVTVVGDVSCVQQEWNQNHLGSGGRGRGIGEGEEEVEDDEEEDDVVFVMGPQDEGEGGMWSHEKRI